MSKELKTVGEHLPKNWQATSADTRLSEIQQQVIAGTKAPKEELTIRDLRLIFARLGAASRLEASDLPNDITLGLCLDVWVSRYTKKLRKHEVTIAFNFNTLGTEWERIVHYQRPSCDFFCDVLNAYMKYRATVIREVQQIGPDTPALSPADDVNVTLQHIIEDYQAILASTVNETVLAIGMRDKMDALWQLLDMNPPIELVQLLRIQAVDGIIARTEAKLKHAQGNNIRREEGGKAVDTKMGEILDCQNKIARLKGAGWNNVDEAEIQAEVKKQMYKYELSCWKLQAGETPEDNELVRHIKSQMI